MKARLGVSRCRGSQGPVLLPGRFHLYNCRWRCSEAARMK